MMRCDVFDHLQKPLLVVCVSDPIVENAQDFVREKTQVFSVSAIQTLCDIFCRLQQHAWQTRQRMANEARQHPGQRKQPWKMARRSRMLKR
eukprot:3899425-Rhodomonas_salina.4